LDSDQVNANDRPGKQEKRVMNRSRTRTKQTNASEQFVNKTSIDIRVWDDEKMPVIWLFVCQWSWLNRAI
jgi:hypothetical protein